MIQTEQECTQKVSQSAFDQATHTRYLGKTAEGKAVYVGRASQAWSIGQVPNGGYVICLMLGAMLNHYADRFQTDPVALNCFFLRKTSVGPLVLEIEDLKTTRKGYCVSRATLKQAKGALVEPTTIEAYDGNLFEEKVQGVFTMGNFENERGLTYSYQSATPPARSTLSPFQYNFMGRFVDSQVDYSKLGHDREVGSGQMEFHQSLQFSDRRQVDFQSIPYWCDMFVSPPNALGTRRLGSKKGVWCATMQLEVQFKAKPKGDEVLCSYVTHDMINSRFDVDGWIWGGDGQLLAITRHQCLCLPWDRNTPPSKL